MPHVHIGTIDAMKFLAMLLFLGYLLRASSARMVNSDNATVQTIGKALAFIY